MKTKNRWGSYWVLSTLALSVMLVGCQPEKEESKSVKEVARPVFARAISSYQPSENRWITGSVAAWKTEEVGFEVAGRVQSVVEPDQLVEGRVLADGGVISPGTPLARLNSQRYQIALKSAQSAVTVASRKRDGLRVQIEEAQKASLRSALAMEELAKVEYERAKQLFEQNASSQSQFDQAKANYDSRKAATENTRAQIKGSRADLSSLEAEIEQAKRNEEIAQLDLKDTVLYSEFRGVVSKVHVVPGSLVRAGDPVVTVQMMDPMKIEFEVSAKVAKSFRRGDTVRLFGGESETAAKPLTGFVYTTDPVADKKTRTFTVTLLARNPATHLAVPPELAGQNIARTEELWPINVESVIGTNLGLLVEVSSLHQDEQGYFLWKAMNRSVGKAATNRVIEVKKVRVQVGPQHVPFFNWVFRPVQFLEPKSVDPKNDLFVGAIKTEKGDPKKWNGKQIIFDQVNWRLLPGDVVKISLANEETPGTYVPFGSVVKTGEQTFIFVADQSAPGKTSVKKVAVNILGAHNEATSGLALCKISPVNSSDTLDGETLLITEGVHYLKDGETIKVVNQQLGEVR